METSLYIYEGFTAAIIRHLILQQGFSGEVIDTFDALAEQWDEKRKAYLASKTM
jgi:hypothetical protein